MRRNNVVAALPRSLALTLACAPGTASAAPLPTEYVNPVSTSFADTFADPSLFRAKDGFWYSYGTSDPLRSGETAAHRIPIARSADLVTWEHVGDAFTDQTLPTWAAPDASIWAPDIRFVDGQYRMYYVVTETTVTSEPHDNAVGMATAPTPVGPWTDSGAPVVAPRRGDDGAPGNFTWNFDPSAVTNTDGSQSLFYGSYYGGVFEVPLTSDGTRTAGRPTMVAVDNKFEGAYPVHRDGYWYLFASTANCCAGPTTGYSVQVGRSRDVSGPYVDRDGNALTASRAGGTPVLNQNGNRWVGAGHNAVVTDVAGQDWIAYHAIDRGTPYLDGTDGINRRPMLLDRLDWVDGWPAVNAGTGPSDTTVPAPVTAGVARFDDGIPDRWQQVGSWSTGRTSQGGPDAHAGSAGALVAATATSAPVRVEADLRSDGATYGLAVGQRSTGSGVVAQIDPTARSVRLREYRAGKAVSTVRADLPAGYRAGDWHAVSLQVRGRDARLQVTNARLQDPLADLTLTLRRPVIGRTSAAALAGGANVGVDDLSATRAATPVTRLVPDVVPSRLDPAASDEFNGSGSGPGWDWVRRDDAAVVQDSQLRWPTEAADLTGTSNSAGVLLRDPGAGPWAIETKLTIDLGTDSVRNFQQAGLIAYVDDDLFTRLSHVAIFNTRQTEFGKETPYAGRLAYGGTIVGPPAETTYLRITHQVDPSSGEHQLRAWSRQPGRAWVKGGVWALPAGAAIRVGLVSHGGAGATAQFDYFRLYR
ncbi:MAG: family 43 glycosylhydrolase [Rhodoferax sp.]|nr:family 43 glycosylhydrolase [Actinomycetota bacterium]